MIKETFKTLEELKKRVAELETRFNYKVGIAVNYKDLTIVY